MPRPETLMTDKNIELRREQEGFYVAHVELTNATGSTALPYYACHDDPSDLLVKLAGDYCCYRGEP